MYIDGPREAGIKATAANASLATYDIPATPENYAIWYEYHSGTNPALQRTIDVIVSHGAFFDERNLRDLYNSFFSSVKEEQAVREASLRALETLQEVIALTEVGRTDAKEFRATLKDFAADSLGKSIETLKSSIDRLVIESRKMSGRTEYFGIRMRESSDKIQTLERNLETALRDATMDALTGVANRKSFDQTLRKMAGDAMNTGDDLSLLMIDIDHFKRVNDTWGHQTGDEVIRHVASALEQSVRGLDFVARYGGEEFAVLLPRSDVASAVCVGENIRHTLARTSLALAVEPPFGPVTVSIGISCYDPGEPLSEWIGRSDAALYRAKADGRDCVRFAAEVGAAL